MDKVKFCQMPLMKEYGKLCELWQNLCMLEIYPLRFLKRKQMIKKTMSVPWHQLLRHYYFTCKIVKEWKYCLLWKFNFWGGTVAVLCVQADREVLCIVPISFSLSPHITNVSSRDRIW